MNRAIQFILGITVGILRDATVRRRAMLLITGAALGLLAIGVFVMWELFVEHPLWFAVFWLVCGWLAVTAMLLAIYDMMVVLRQGRKDRAAVRRKIFGDTKDN